MSKLSVPGLTLDERRKLLKQAEQLSNQTPSIIQAQEQALMCYRSAINGASEEERKSLAKTLSASRLFKAEGPTQRACLVLAGLGTAKNAAEKIFHYWSPANHSDNQRHAAAAKEICSSVFDGAHDRDETWLYDFIDVATKNFWAFRKYGWTLLRRLILSRGLTPLTPEYLLCFVQNVSARIGQSDGESQGDRAENLTVQASESPEGQEIVAALLADESLIENEFWALFSVEPLGANWQLTDYAAQDWNAAITTLSQTRPGFRERILDESLKGQLRDFTTKNVTWYHRVHRLLDPTAAEVTARQSLYNAVLQTTSSMSVGLAQDMLARIEISDVDTFLDASAAVMQRKEKKLVRVQLRLLKRLVKANPNFAGRVSDLIADVLGGLPLDIATQARVLMIDAATRHSSTVTPLESSGVFIDDGNDLTTLSGTQSAALSAQSSLSSAEYPSQNTDSVITTTTTTIAPPRLTKLSGALPEPSPITSELEFLGLVAEHIEGNGHGSDIPRLLTYLCSTPPPATSPTALIQRAKEIFNDVWDYGGNSPRRQLAVLLLTWVGEDTRRLDYQGYQRFTYHPNKPFHYSPVETHSPSALLANVMKQAQLTISRQVGGSTRPTTRGSWPRSQTSRNIEIVTATLPTPIPAATTAWCRKLAVPGDGRYGANRVLGADPKPFWTHLTPVSLSKRASFTELALDVADVPAEFSFRAELAREQDGFDQIVQWAAWLYRDNPDTLAAHAHPILCAAVQVVNVRGVGPALTALGQSSQPLAAPSYSALSLGLSAKMTEHRAIAAESVANLARSGLLHPELLAEQLQAHLNDNFVLAGRVTLGLADAASINAIAGYRVLQTLVELLPSTGTVTGGAKLVELAARLAADYGSRVDIPEVLTSKTNRSSVMAVALRALATVQPHATSLAVEAALQASEG